MFIHQVTFSLKSELFFTVIALPLGVEKELSLSREETTETEKQNDTGHP